MRRQGWVLALAVLVTVGGLAAAGRLLELPVDRSSPAPSPPDQVTSVATFPPAETRIPRTVWRPLRLPSPGRDGSCPTSPAVGPPRTADQPVAAVAVGDGPVYPVLFRAAVAGRLDHSAVAYWEAPTPLGGPAIIRGHRLGDPRDRVRFRDNRQELRLVHVLDPATAHPDGSQGSWWRPTRLRAAAGCYGLQIDGPRFSQVVVVEFA